MSGSESKPIVFLEGERVYARPLESGDLARCQRWINDPETRATLATYLPMSEAAERKWLEGCADNNNEINLAIVLKKGDRHIGNMGLRGFRWKDRAADFGIVIGEVECRGKGYGKEATELVLKYAFETLNLNRVQLGVFAHNPAGIKAYEAVGFVREGVQREHNFVEGRYADHVMYSMLAREYFANRQA